MKSTHFFVPSIILYFLISCGQNKVPKTEKQEEIEPIRLSESDHSAKKETASGYDVLKLSELIPIDTINPTSKNVYEKYGLEFSGNCYDCDLAEIRISRNSLYFVNVCAESENLAWPILETKPSPNQVIYKTRDYDFIFTEIDKAPVYELQVKRKEWPFENLRVSSWYTTKTALKKFKSHDCGDFDG